MIDPIDAGVAIILLAVAVLNLLEVFERMAVPDW